MKHYVKFYLERIVLVQSELDLGLKSIILSNL